METFDKIFCATEHDWNQNNQTKKKLNKNLKADV